MQGRGIWHGKKVPYGRRMTQERRVPQGKSDQRTGAPKKTCAKTSDNDPPDA